MGHRIRLNRILLLFALLCIVAILLYDIDEQYAPPDADTATPLQKTPSDSTEASRILSNRGALPQDQKDVHFTPNVLPQKTIPAVTPKRVPDPVTVPPADEDHSGPTAIEATSRATALTAASGIRGMQPQRSATTAGTHPETVLDTQPKSSTLERAQTSGPQKPESGPAGWDGNAPESGTAATDLTYVDRLIDESVAGDEFGEDADRGEGALWGGLSFFNLAYRYYTDHNDLAGTLNEHGVSLVARKETINYGNYELQADGLLTDERDQQYVDGGRVLFTQRGFVINDTWQMDSDIGHYRSQTPRLISNSFKFFLPPTLLQGLSANWHDQRTALSLSAGEIGAINGVAARAFETTQGNLQGAAVTHEFNDRWSTGLQFWNTVNAIDTGTHQSYAGAIQYAHLDRSHVHQLHYLTDSRGNSGLWLDGEIKHDRWFHNLGLFYFEPELLWTDVLIDNDRAGFYWRGDRRGFRWQWTVGTDVTKNNLDEDENLAGYISTVSFINSTWRYRRNTSFGATFNVGTRHADSGTALDDTYRYTLRSFMNQKNFLGNTHLQARASFMNGTEDQADSYGFLWDQGWNVPFFKRLNTDIEYVSLEDDPDELSLRLILEKDIGNAIWFNCAGQYIYADGPNNDRRNAANVSISANWQFHQNWKLSLAADYNRNEFQETGGVIQSVEGNTVLLTLSYAASGGKQAMAYGRDTGSLGRGEIAGRVFLDENRNGRHDLGEDTLEGIPVILDGQYSIDSDANGDFGFWPVAGGDHVITISVEDVPLPWGLVDETPRTVTVPVRGRATVDFGLVKLNE